MKNYYRCMREYNPQTKYQVVTMLDIVNSTGMQAEGWTKVQFHDTCYSISAKNKGKVANNAGDGSLVLFENAMNAIEFAIEVQSIFINKFNINVRIGISSGEIEIIDIGNDIIYSGMPINHASRIESMGVAGSILIAGKVKNDVEKEGVESVYIGDFYFKGVDFDTDVFAVIAEDIHIPHKSDHIVKKDLEKSFLLWCFSINKKIIFTSISFIALLFLIFQIYDLVSFLPQIIAEYRYNIIYRNFGYVSNIGIPLLAIFYLNDMKSKFYCKDNNKSSIANLIKVDSSELDKLYKRANNGINEFLTYFKFAWFAFFMLYVVLLLDFYIQSDIYVIASHFLNNISALFILICAIILTYRPPDTQNSQVDKKAVITISTMVIIVSAVEILLFTFSSDLFDNLQFTFDIISGSFSAICLGLLSARIDSSLLKTEQWIVVGLISYVAIQPLFAFLDSSQLLGPILINFALFGKSLLLLYIIWIFETKRMLYFFLNINQITHRLERKWNEIQYKL